MQRQPVRAALPRFSFEGIVVNGKRIRRWSSWSRSTPLESLVGEVEGVAPCYGCRRPAFFWWDQEESKYRFVEHEFKRHLSGRVQRCKISMEVVPETALPAAVSSRIRKLADDIANRLK